MFVSLNVRKNSVNSTIGVGIPLNLHVLKSLNRQNPTENDQIVKLKWGSWVILFVVLFSDYIVI